MYMIISILFVCVVKFKDNIYSVQNVGRKEKLLLALM